MMHRTSSPRFGRGGTASLLALASVAVASSAPAFPQSAVAAPLELVALPGARHGHRVEPLAGGLLSFGGFGDDLASDRPMRQTWYLPAGASAWLRKADLKVARAFAGSAVFAGSVFAVGEGIERYDLAADRWVEVMPAGSLPRSHFAAAAVGGTLYVLGGYGPSPSHLLAVDLIAPDGTFRAAPTVRELPAPPGYAPGDHFHLLHSFGGRLHVLGGLDGETFQPKAEHWVLDPEGWRAQAAPPAPLWGKFLVQAAAGDRLYLFGDCGAWCFDARERSWAARAPLDMLLVMPQAIVLGERLHVLGGLAVDGERGAILRSYDVAADRWLPAPGT